MHDRDYQLIIGYLEGTLKDHEVQELLQKVAQDPVFSASLREVASLWEIPKQTEKTNITAEKALQKWHVKQSDFFVQDPVKLQTRKTFNAYQWMAAASVAILLIVFAAILFRQNFSSNEPTEKAYTRLMTQAGKRKHFLLPDGSAVWLNASSTLWIPKNYGEQERQLILEGEALFDVKPNKKRPFVVISGEIKTTVLGTQFNVSAHQPDKEIKVSLLTGKVQVDVGGSVPKTMVLTPGNELCFQKTEKTHVIQHFSEETTIGWKENILVFNYESWPEVAHKLTRWYNIPVHLEGETHPQQMLKGTFKNLSLQEVMQQISMITGIQYEIRKEGVYINPMVKP